MQEDGTICPLFPLFGFSLISPIQDYHFPSEYEQNGSDKTNGAQ